MYTPGRPSILSPSPPPPQARFCSHGKDREAPRVASAGYETRLIIKFCLKRLIAIGPEDWKIY